MATDRSRLQCPDCQENLSRREFMSTAAGTALAVSSALTLPRSTRAAPTPASKAESAVKRLFESLSEEQKKVVAKPFDDPLRTKISANWKITKATVESFSVDQQQIIKEILRGVTSEDGYERFLEQMAHDQPPGLARYTVAIFGDPAKGPFEFEMTGRHLTLRADGDSVPGAAFGGPIVYGHGARGNSKANLFSYQTKRANEVFAALDGKQREKALVEKAPSESAVQLRPEGQPLPGIGVGELASDQQDLVGEVLADILLPYRKEDVEEVMEVVKAGGGLGQVHMTFYRAGDIGNDQVWDIWRLEGPTLVCHFRGAPHVHAYINIARRS